MFVMRILGVYSTPTTHTILIPTVYTIAGGCQDLPWHSGAEPFHCPSALHCSTESPTSRCPVLHRKRITSPLARPDPMSSPLSGTLTDAQERRWHSGNAALHVPSGRQRSKALPVNSVSPTQAYWRRVATLYSVCTGGVCVPPAMSPGCPHMMGKHDGTLAFQPTPAMHCSTLEPTIS